MTDTSTRGGLGTNDRRGLPLRRGIRIRTYILIATMGTVANCGHMGIEPQESDEDVNSGSGGKSTNGGSSPGGSGGSTLGTGASSSGGTSSGGSRESGGAGTGGTAAGGQGEDGGQGGEAGEGGLGGLGGQFGSSCSSGEFGPLELITGLDVDGDKWSPSVTRDGLILVFAVSDAETESIYQATRASRKHPFGAATLIDLRQSTHQGTPFVASDGLALYYSIENFGGTSTRDLWVAWRDRRSDQFGGRTPLDSINSTARDHLPWLSVDERTIYFTTARQTESWLSEIWTAERIDTTDYEYTFSALAPVSTERIDSEDGSPSLSPDGLTLYFASDRGGEFDVWSMSRASLTAPFQGATREDALSEQGEEVHLHLSPDGREMYLSSTGDSRQELFVSQRNCPE